MQCFVLIIIGMLLVGVHLWITMPQVCDANCATCKKAGHL